MSPFTAIYDACVLYPAELRNLLMYLALTDLFRAKWTNAIHEEWIEALLNTRDDVTREKLERTRDLMNAHVRDCLVTDYEDLIPTIHLPDPDDRHVVAAAIRGRADVIVTLNLKDFPSRILAPLGIEAQHPDEFITHLLDLDAVAVCVAVKQQRQSLKKPPMTIEELLIVFERCGLIKTSVRLREFAPLL